MSLLDLPPELRLRIYDHLPEFDDTHRANVTVHFGTALTPALSRTSRLLRRETLPLYAQAAHFAIPLEEQHTRQHSQSDPVNVWLDALRELGIAKLYSLQLSNHWKITQPTRWQTHVGFYLRLEREQNAGLNFPQSAGWKCSIGTYPIAKDIRGMRLESVELLQRHVRTYLGWAYQERQLVDHEPKRKTNANIALGFVRSDLDFIIEAMTIVARHPISTYDLNQDQQGRQSRRGTFVKMENELARLAESYGVRAAQQGTFYTPY